MQGQTPGRRNIALCVKHWLDLAPTTQNRLTLSGPAKQAFYPGGFAPEVAIEILETRADRRPLRPARSVAGGLSTSGPGRGRALGRAAGPGDHPGPEPRPARLSQTGPG